MMALIERQHFFVIEAVARCEAAVKPPLATSHLHLKHRYLQVFTNTTDL